MKIAFAGASDVGRVREENQDSIFVPNELPAEGNPALFFLADGMGGRKGGSIASQTAVTVLQEYFSSEPAADLSKALKDGVQKASLAIFHKSEEETQLRGMGTTVVALAVQDGQAVVANVGDSRAYIFRGGRLRQITEDHSLVAQQVRDGLLTPKEAKSSPMRNLITKAAGAIPDVEPDVFQERLETGDILLMCSDGLHGPVDDGQIIKVLSSRSSLDEQVQDLIKRANKAGGPDNISVILVRAEHVPNAKDAANATGELTEKMTLSVSDQQAQEAPRSAMAKALVYLVPLAGAALGLWWFLTSR